MTKKIIEFSGAMDKNDVFEVLADELGFTYGNPDFDSIEDALTNLDWENIPAEIFLVIKSDFKMNPVEDKRQFLGALTSAYSNRSILGYNNEIYLKLLFE